MLDFNYWYIVLWVALLFVIRELIGTIKDIEKKVYIYWEEKHSIDHISYLATYIFALLIYLVWEVTSVDSAYFEVLLWASTIILCYHLRKERNHKHK